LSGLGVARVDQILPLQFVLLPKRTKKPHFIVDSRATVMPSYIVEFIAL